MKGQPLDLFALITAGKAAFFALLNLLIVDDV